MKLMKIGRLLVGFSDGVWTVTRGGQTAGYVSFVRCTGASAQWTRLRNNCHPFNGPLSVEKPPIGRWLVAEFVGRTSSSANIYPDVASNGFTDKEIYAVVDMINLAF